MKSQATRSRTQNRKIARTILAEKLEELEKGSESRVAVKAEVKRKRKASSSKKSRRKYRRLEDETSTGAIGDDDDKQNQGEDADDVEMGTGRI